jgi:hypothetical protein
VKRTLTIVGIIVLLLAIGVGTYFVLLVRGIGGVDDWTVRKVVTIVNTALEPQLAFDSVSLSIGADQNEDGAPYAITFDTITLTAPDGTEVVRANSLRVALAEMPKRGRPIAIANISLGAPEIRLIREQLADGTTGFRGLVPFVKPNPTERDLDPETEGTTTLSDVLDLREVLVTGASIVYEDRTNPDLQAMRLDGIGFDLTTQPEQTADGRTLHTLDIAFGRAPIFELDLDGKVDLDALTAEIASLAIRADLAEEEAVSALPPQVQQIIRDYAIRGMLDASVSGFVDARNLRGNNLTLSANLTDGNFASGEYRVPVAGLELRASLNSMVAQIDSMVINTLGGIIRIDEANADLGAERTPLRAKWTIEGIQLREALRSESNEDPKMAGIVSGSGQVDTLLGDVRSAMAGGGSISVREGRLVNIPVLSAILAAADLLGGLQGKERGFNDTLDTEFSLTAAGLDLSSLQVVVPVAKFNGTGLIGFDGSLDLRMRGGAVEKIPVLGNIAGAVTGKLVEYRITREPGEKVSVRLNPLGIGN